MTIIQHRCLDLLFFFCSSGCFVTIHQVQLFFCAFIQLWSQTLSPPPCTSIWSAIFLHKWQKTHTVIKVKHKFDSIHFEKTFYSYQDKWVNKFTVIIVEGNLIPWQPQMLYVIILFIFQRYDYECSTVCHRFHRRSSNQFRPLDWPEVTYCLLACKLVQAVYIHISSYTVPWHFK